MTDTLADKITHRAVLWLTNDYNAYKGIQSRARAIFRDTWENDADEESLIIEVLGTLADDIESICDSGMRDNTLHGEIMSLAFAHIDWLEVAYFWQDEVRDMFSDYKLGEDE